MSRVCDILVDEEKVPFYLRWLKGKSVFNVFVGNENGFCSALKYSDCRRSAIVTEKQLKNDRGAITRTAVKLAKDFGAIG